MKRRYCKQFHYLIDQQASQNMQVRDIGSTHRSIEVSLQTPMIGEQRKAVLRLSRAMAIELATLLVDCAKTIPEPPADEEYDGCVID